MLILALFPFVYLLKIQPFLKLPKQNKKYNTYSGEYPCKQVIVLNIIIKMGITVIDNMVKTNLATLFTMTFGRHIALSFFF